MFDYSLLHWTAFLGAAALLNLSPGPDSAFILGQSVRGGTRAGFAAMLGIWTGAFGHVLLAVVGLSAVLAASALVFPLVKWLGAAYLIGLGIAVLRSQGGSFFSTRVKSSSQFFPVYRQGVIVALLNPKVAIFFLAFLPQFVVSGAGPLWAQLFLHDGLIIAVAALIEPPLVIAGARLTGALRDNPRFALWLDRSLGAILISLGVRLVFVER